MTTAENEEPIAVSHLPRRGEAVTLRIDRYGDDGSGRGTLHFVLQDRTRRKLRISVARAVVGDLVRAELYDRRGDGGDARLLEIVEPSSERVEPFCPHAASHAFGSAACGGCPMQATSHARQLEFRRERVRSALATEGIDAQPDPTLPAPSNRFGRNRIELSFAAAADRTLALGFHPPGFRHEVVEPVACDVFSAVAPAVIAHVRGFFAERGVRAVHVRDPHGWLRTLAIREGKRTGEHQLILTTTQATRVLTSDGERDADALVDDFARTVVEASASLGLNLRSVVHVRHVAERGTPTRFDERAVFGDVCWHEALLAPSGRMLHFEIHPRAFFQPNTLQAERLYAVALAALAADRPAGGTVLDLYCGAGTISLMLADAVDRVIGIELVPEAVDAARRAAAANGVSNVEFHCGDAGKVLGEKLDSIGTIDGVIVDPPRGGLSSEAVTHISSTGARRLVYVSCNPDSLARDLKLLLQDGWVIVSVQPVDMFPHTPHVETVVRLDRP